jgi:hypothetical protein
LYSLVVIGWLSPGTQDLLKENLNLKKYLNVVTYENQQLKEALKRQKGYLERSPQTLEKERGEEQDKKGDWTNDWQAAIRLETVTDKIHFTPFYRHFSKVGKNGRRTIGREKIREKGMERNGCCLSIRVEKNVIGNRLFLSVLGSGAARLRAALFSELI